VTHANGVPSPYRGESMCGRLVLHSQPEHLARFLNATLIAGMEPRLAPTWNLTPQQDLLAVSQIEGQGRVMNSFRWGLLPAWAVDTSFTANTINARAETVREKPSFRDAFAQRPCIIPVDGFYEWDRRDGHGKRAHYFFRSDGQPMLLAGLYEHWVQPGHDPRTTCTIVTSAANENMAELHDRMPVIVEEQDVTTWLTAPASDRYDLLRPPLAKILDQHGVSDAVGNIRNNGPALVAPAERSTLF